MAMVCNNVASWLELAPSLGADPRIARSAWLKVTTWPGGAGTMASYAFTGAQPTPTNGFGVENAPAQPSFMFYGNTVNGPEPQLTVAEVASAFTGWMYFFQWVDATGVLRSYFAVDGGADPTLLFTSGAGNQGVVDNLYEFSPFFNCIGKISDVIYWTGADAVFSGAQVISQFKQKAPIKTSGLLTYLSGNAGGTVGIADLGSNWTVVGTGITLDSDQPTFPQAASNSIFYGTDC